MDELSILLSRMVVTIAVMMLMARFISGNNNFTKWMAKQQKSRVKTVLLAGAIGGVFGIYANISGFEWNGAVISLRDIGPMLAGFIGGPLGGLFAGVIAGLHRLLWGGVTAPACMVATCLIGLFCGIISKFNREFIKKPYWAFLVSAGMEIFHLGVALLMVKPFDTALNIVKQIALPFTVMNAIGFALLMSMIAFMERQNRLKEERDRLQSELEVATVIQNSLLPELTADYPGRAEVEVRGSMQPAKEVGGDFYDVFFVDKDRIAFLIGDVSGKGIPAALFMAYSKITLQNCIRDIPALGEAVATANNALCARNEADMFITLWVGVLDLQSGEITYVNAGHNPPVTVLSGEVSYLTKKSGLVLAGMDGVPYKEHTLTLQKGDTVFLYTDGVTEAENAANELYGEDRLLTCFEQIKNSAPEEVIETIKQSVEIFVNGADQFDDMTMLCFKWK